MVLIDHIFVIKWNHIDLKVWSLHNCRLFNLAYMTHKFINNEKLAMELSLLDVLTVSSLFLIIVVFMTCQFRNQLKTISVWTKVMSNLIVLLLIVEFWSIVTRYCVINGIQYQRWLKIASLTDSLLSNQWNTISEMTKK